jgi:type I restriction enzyme S subunit
MRRYIAAKKRLIVLLRERRKLITYLATTLPTTKFRRLEHVAARVARPIERSRDALFTPIGLFNRGRGIFLKSPRCGADLGDSDFFWIEKDDVVVSGQFAWEGAVALANDTHGGCIASHRYHVFRGLPNVLVSGYLLAYLQTDEGQALLEHHSRGGAGRNRPLNPRTLGKERIPVPPLSEQHTIAALVELESRVTAHVTKAVALANDFRTRVIADVVTGRFDVREGGCAPTGRDRGQVRDVMLKYGLNE